MTNKELLEALAEIEQLKRDLGRKPLVIKVPQGSGPTAPGTRGRCVVCDKEFEADDTIRRCAKSVAIARVRNGETVTTHHTKGYRVCFHCSPWTWDWQLDRYAENIGAWPEHWKSGADTGVRGTKSVPFNRTVFELDLRDKTPDEEYLEDRIAKLERILKK